VPSDVPPAVPGLFRRCGDDVPVYCDELFITPQALVVEQARAAADGVWLREQEGPDRVALAYPSGWGAGRVGLLRAALDDAGMEGVALVTRARAVVERLRATGRPVPSGRVVAVCRIGRAGTEVSLVIPSDPGRLELLGSAEADDVGGDDLAAGGPAEARAVVAAVLDLLRRTARGCGVELADLAAVLLAGGGAGHPLVGEVLAEALAAPIIRDDDPRLTVARGAALSMRRPAEVPPPAGPSPAESGALVLPTELVPTTTGSDRVPDPGAMPPRPPLHVVALEVGRR
jgi:molecular chaperone DnaK (HSP70)